MSELTIRPASAGDVPFLHAMLAEAAFWRDPPERRPDLDRALRAPELAVYLQGWGRPGDRALCACLDRDRVGAAWYRTYSSSDHGYGFVDEGIPELTIGVATAHRRRGVGRALLAALIVQGRLDRRPALSLSVERDNPAVALYGSLGFEPVATGGGAVTMVARLAP